MQINVSSILFCACIILFGMPTANAVIYDDFDDGNFLSSDHWTTPERTNLVVNGRLLSAIRRLGSTGGSDNQFPNATNIDAIQAVVNVTNIEPLGSSEIRARIGGFFCDSNNTADGSLGEIYAEASTTRQPDGTLSFRYLVFQCSNDNCTDGNDLLDNFFGSPQLNTDYSLALSFDPTSRTFVFSVDTGDNATFGPNDASELANCGTSNSPFKTLGTRIFIESGAPGDGGSIQAEFDDILINGMLYDDFNSGVLDPSKWNDTEGRIAVETENGNNVLRLEQNLAGGGRSLSTGFVDSGSIDAIRADIRVDRTAIVAVGDNGQVRARLYGIFYNDGASSGGDDQTGDVFAQMRINRDVDGGQDRFQILCGAFRIDDPDFDSSTGLFFERFNATWQEGQTHRLTLGFDPINKAFVCGFDDQTFIYTLQALDPQPDNVSALRSNKQLGVRVDDLSGPGDRGEISAVFDNVQIFPPRAQGDFLFSGNFEPFPDL